MHAVGPATYASPARSIHTYSRSPKNGIRVGDLRWTFLDGSWMVGHGVSSHCDGCGSAARGGGIGALAASCVRWK
jgi:hypothetical protein